MQAVTLQINQWNISSFIPLGSGKTVRGFELRVISLSEPYVNRKLCAVFNLSNAVWTDEDIVSMVENMLLIWHILWAIIVYFTLNNW